MNKSQNRTESNVHRRSILTALIGAPVLAALPAAALALPSERRWGDVLIDFARATKALAIHPETPEGHQYVARLILRRMKEIYCDEAEMPTQPEPPHVFSLFVYATCQLLECPDTPRAVYVEIAYAIEKIRNIPWANEEPQEMRARRILEEALGLPQTAA